MFKTRKELRVRIVISLTGILLRLLGYGLLASSIGGLIVYIHLLQSGPDLAIWHYADLDEEFTVSSEVSSFNQYLALENRLLSNLMNWFTLKLPRGIGICSIVSAEAVCLTRGVGLSTGTGVSYWIMSNQSPAFYYYTACLIHPIACELWDNACTKRAHQCWGYEYPGTEPHLPLLSKPVGRIWLPQ